MSNERDLAKYVRSRCCRDGECLLWQGALNSSRLPTFRLQGTGTRDPRRVLWEAAGRKLLPGYVFARTDCDERCIEPNCQVYLPRRAASVRAAAAGRLSQGLRHSIAVRRGMAKRLDIRLNEQIVAAMRARHAEIGNAAQVAREFGLDHAHTHRVVTNKAWRRATPFG